MDSLELIETAAAPVAEWLVIIAGLGIGIGIVVKVLQWGWWIFQEMATDHDAEARRAGYKDSADRGRDHW